MTSSTGPVPTSVDVAVVGAGIGGLAAAVALRHAGLDAQVFERTPVLSEVGGAVVIREPSVRLLESWGLQAFRDQAVPIEVMEMHDAAGAVTHTMGADIVGDGQAYSTHRHDVHALLLGALPSEVLHLGLTAASVTNDVDASGPRSRSPTAPRCRRGSWSAPTGSARSPARPWSVTTRCSPDWSCCGAWHPPPRCPKGRATTASTCGPRGRR